MIGKADSRLPFSGAEVRATVHMGVMVENRKKQGFYYWT
jgi:hypothetical protein